MSLNPIAEDARGGDVVLTGKAGAGKTGCVIECVEALRSQGIRVLAFRLDRLSPVSSTHAFGQQLGLEESPALVLAAAAEDHEAVLVVDQLDAVSTISGRSADFSTRWKGYSPKRGAYAKVKAAWSSCAVRLTGRTMTGSGGCSPTTMLRWKWQSYRSKRLAQCSAEHFTVELFSPRQLELLRLPQNLSLFLDAGFDPTTTPTFHTAKELFDRYWDAPNGGPWLCVRHHRRISGGSHQPVER